jgi:hypothetical protein
MTTISTIVPIPINMGRLPSKCTLSREGNCLIRGPRSGLAFLVTAQRLAGQAASHVRAGKGTTVPGEVPQTVPERAVLPECRAQRLRPLLWRGAGRRSRRQQVVAARRRRFPEGVMDPPPVAAEARPQYRRAREIQFTAQAHHDRVTVIAEWQIPALRRVRLRRTGDNVRAGRCRPGALRGAARIAAGPGIRQEPADDGYATCHLGFGYRAGRHRGPEQPEPQIWCTRAHRARLS